MKRSVLMVHKRKEEAEKEILMEVINVSLLFDQGNYEI